MPVTIKSKRMGRYLIATFTGLTTMSQAREYIGEILPMLEKTGYKRLLCDSMNASGQLSTADLAQLPKLIAESPLAAGLKQAYLFPEKSIERNMYETFSKMQGLNLQIFTDRAEAIKWLLKEDHDPRRLPR